MSGRENLLAHLGRRSYVSQSGISNLLKELHAIGSLPSQTSRSSVKRARDKNLHAMSTPYGPLVRRVKVHIDGVDYEFDYIHPIAFLAYAAQHCDPFGEILVETAANHPSHCNAKWDIILYSDEVTPGDALKRGNQKKTQAIYWSFKQFGSELLASEYLWFVVVVLRSNNDLLLHGGMTTLFRYIWETFFDDVSNLRAGVIINTSYRAVVIGAYPGLDSPG